MIQSSVPDPDWYRQDAYVFGHLGTDPIIRTDPVPDMFLDPSNTKQKIKINHDLLFCDFSVTCYL